MPLRILPLFCIRVWDYPNKQNGHGPAGAGFGRFSGVWPHSLCLLRYLSPCYVTSPLVPLPPSSVIIVQIGMPKLYAKDRKFLEKRKR